MRCALMLSAVATALLAPSAAQAVVLDQVDDFEEASSVMNWVEGGSSPNPPENVATGGPAGDGDNYLQNESSGAGRAGSRMIMFNRGQWQGNYLAADADEITAQMANLTTGSDPSDLHMRIALEGAGSRYASTDPILLTPNGQWTDVSFSLAANAMTNLVGSAPVADVLADVFTLRILSRENGPGWEGDRVEAILGVDNITAVSVAQFLLGDVNNDGSTNNLDITPFIVALTIGGPTDDPNKIAQFDAQVAGGNFAAADANNDSVVDNIDITDFIGLVAAPASAVPEPTALIGLAAAGAPLLLRRNLRA